MSRLERYAKLLEGIDLENGVAVEDRIFVGPEEVIEKVRELEKLYKALSRVNILELYNRTIAHDGMHEEDIYNHGRYYAYFNFELKGQSNEEKEEILVKSLESIVEEFGKELVLKYFPKVIKGRRVTEDLKIRPEDEDYPSYYSEFRTNYAEKMAKEEVPYKVLSGIREDEDALLEEYDWNTLYVTASDGKLIEICGDVYLIEEGEVKEAKVYAQLWNFLIENGKESMYDFSIATDGEYPKDEYNPFGRYYAYVKLELKGLSEDGRKKFLSDTLPEDIVKKIGIEELSQIFPKVINGDLVTQPLTLRPDEEEFPSHFNERKIEKGKERAYKQVLYNIRAAILDRLADILGEIKKVIILEKTE
ncbi:MAG: hypothetical protein J7K04_02905 [Spirochaetales bacterium]|nr:hypothetical protein [Spirochaetales bacterium]